MPQHQDAQPHSPTCSSPTLRLGRVMMELFKWQRSYWITSRGRGRSEEKGCNDNVFSLRCRQPWEASFSCMETTEGSSAPRQKLHITLDFSLLFCLSESWNETLQYLILGPRQNLCEAFLTNLRMNADELRRFSVRFYGPQPQGHKYTKCRFNFNCISFQNHALLIQTDSDSGNCT